MKITLEPSEDQTGREYPQHKVILETSDDEILLENAVELIEYALKGWGFYFHRLTIIDEDNVQTEDKIK